MVRRNLNRASLVMQQASSTQSHDCSGNCRSCAAVGSCPDRVVCRCLQVTEQTVITTITTHGVRSVHELRVLTGAGDGCCCCHRELKSYLAVYSPAESSSPEICSAR